MSLAITIKPTGRAALAAALFTACGAGSAWRSVSDWSLSAPLVLFYALLVLNTFFSVRCFARVTPPGDRLQKLFDAVLVAIYVGLAASFTDAPRFAGWGSLLFAVATLKYVVLLGRVGSVMLLAKKIRVDVLGTIACVWALGVMLIGYAREASWALAGANAIANVYVLWVRPIYRIEGLPPVV